MCIDAWVHQYRLWDKSVPSIEYTANPQEFNGVVFACFFNTTAGMDASRFLLTAFSLTR